MTAAEALRVAEEKFRGGQYTDAENILRPLLQQNPNEPRAWDLLGLIAEQMRHHEPALQCFAAAVKLAPDNFVFRYHLANMHRVLAKDELAIAEYREVLRLRPDLTDARVNLGIALANLGKYDEAIEQWQAVLAVEPNSVECLANLGNLYRIMGRIGDAITYSRRAIAIRPDSWSNLGVAYEQQGKLDEAIDAYRHAMELRKSPGANSNLLMALGYHGSMSPQKVFEEHVAFGKRFGEPLAPEIRPLTNDRDPDRKLRIGYVSADFREHSIAFFIEPVLQHHNREDVEIFCYSSVGRPDAITQRLQTYPATWRSLVGMRNDVAAQMVRDDRIDILVDLHTHTAGNRLLVFARKPAPVQVTWLGYASTTGMPTIDWRITDPIVDPPGLTEALHTEKLMRLPRTQWCFRPPDAAPDVSLPPHETAGFITFGNATNLAKITPQTIELWSGVLRAVPESRLALKARSFADEATRKLVVESFAAHGVNASRVLLEGAGDLRGYLEFFARIDICLDTFPFAGGTTTCHTLWMGAAVITLVGATSVSRVGASVLTNVGLADLIAQSPAQFIEISQRLAGDAQRLRTLRQNLRQMMTNSPLCDGPGFMRDLENAYREMWRAWAL